VYHAAVTNTVSGALTTLVVALLCVSDHSAAAAAPSAQAAAAPTAAQISCIHQISAALFARSGEARAARMRLLDGRSSGDQGG
jgi:hypothetical protein